MSGAAEVAGRYGSGAAVRRIEDLQGKLIAVPSLTALGASLLLRAELDQKYQVRPRVVVAKTHSSVFLHVLNGFADAGGSVQKALAELMQASESTARALIHRDEAAIA